MNHYRELLNLVGVCGDPHIYDQLVRSESGCRDPQITVASEVRVVLWGLFPHAVQFAQLICKGIFLAHRN